MTQDSGRGEAGADFNKSVERIGCPKHSNAGPGPSHLCTLARGIQDADRYPLTFTGDMIHLLSSSSSKYLLSCFWKGRGGLGSGAMGVRIDEVQGS